MPKGKRQGVLKHIVNVTLFLLIFVLITPKAYALGNPDIEFSPLISTTCTEILITDYAGSIHGGSYDSLIYNTDTGDFKGDINSFSIGDSVCPTDHIVGTMDNGTYAIVFSTGSCGEFASTLNYADCKASGALEATDKFIIGDTPPPTPTASSTDMTVVNSVALVGLWFIVVGVIAFVISIFG